MGDKAKGLYIISLLDSHKLIDVIKMDEKQFIGHITQEVNVRLDDLLRNVSLLHKPDPIEIYSENNREKIDEGAYSNFEKHSLDLKELPVSSNDLVWGIERIISSPESPVVQEYGNFRGFVTIDGGPYDITVSTDLSKVTNVNKIGEYADEVNIEEGQEIEEAIRILLDYAFKQDDDGPLRAA